MYKIKEVLNEIWSEAKRPKYILIGKYLFIIKPFSITIKKNK